MAPSTPLRGIFLFLFTRNPCHDGPSRPGKRDVTADRHETWGGDAMDADDVARRAMSTRTAKACGPDIPTLISSLAGPIREAMVAKKPGAPGRARYTR